MEIKNLDDLRAAYPDLLAQAESAAQAEGCARGDVPAFRASRTSRQPLAMPRWSENAKSGDEPVNAEQLAFAAMKAQAAIGANMLGKLAADAAKQRRGRCDPDSGTVSEHPRRASRMRLSR